MHELDKLQQTKITKCFVAILFIYYGTKNIMILIFKHPLPHILCLTNSNYWYIF